MGWRLSSVAAIAVLAVGGSVLAQDAGGMAGTYQFTTTDKGAGGKPVCTEQWTLGADGRFVIASGQERIEGRWTTEKENTLSWLVETERTSNHAPDCQGNVSNDTAPQVRLFYWVDNDGHVSLCAPPQMVNGSPYISNCYASLVRK